MRFAGLVVFVAAAMFGGAARAAADDAVAVNPDNFPRAEADLHFSAVVKDGGLGKFRHQRFPASPEKPTSVEPDRDTLSSDAVLDLDAGPVTIKLPDAAPRYLSLQIVDEDGYTPKVVYGPQTVTLTRESIGTRYALAALRIFVDAGNPKDVETVNALQDAVRIDQPGGPGVFKTPNWDAATEVDVRTGLRVLAETLTDTKGMLGARGDVDPVHRLIGAAAAWGALPERDVLVTRFAPERNDGTTVYRLTLKDTPVDGFWSIAVYNSRGFFQPNPEKTYSVTNPAAEPDPKGGVTIQFGGCDATVPNCLPTPPDWSLVARLYRPHAQALNGGWTLPKLVEMPPAPAKPSANAAKAGPSAQTAAGASAAKATAPPKPKRGAPPK